jgi:predicted RNA binding protein YcfA (HicA-like mRNA interferase family)
MRQEGSHIRLTTRLDGEYHLTIPNHTPLRVGTFRSILKLAAAHHGLSVEELLIRLGF